MAKNDLPYGVYVESSEGWFILDQNSKRAREMWMAKRGTTKRASMEQESYIAKRYNGIVSPSSGAAVSDQGDVRNCCELFEAKQTGTPDKYAKSVSIKMSDLEKIVDEAWSEGRSPVIALRVYNPDYVFADKDGNIDLIVRLLDDDVERGCNCGGKA